MVNDWKYLDKQLEERVCSHEVSLFKKSGLNKSKLATSLADDLERFFATPGSHLPGLVEKLDSPIPLKKRFTTGHY